MSDDDKLMELERLLNDPDSKMEPDRVWSLLAELAQQQPDLMASRTAAPSYRFPTAH